MKLNPEFQRQCWQALTPHRLVVMPVVLGVAFYLMWRVDAWQLFGVAIMIFVVLVVFWGTMLAADSLTHEVMQHTWDHQRLSSMDPWTLVWGKLTGSTIFAWYGGGISLSVMVVVGRLAIGRPWAELLQLTVLLISGGVLSQGLGLLLALLGVRKGGQQLRVHRGERTLLAGLVALPFLSFSSSIFPSSHEAVEKVVLWYGFAWHLRTFVLFSVLLFMAWTVVALYRVMREELQMGGGPWAWLVFLLCFVIYAFGFFPGSHLGKVNFEPFFASFILIFWVIVLVGTYVTAFFEPKDSVTLRRLAQSVRQGHVGTFLRTVPLWLATLVLLLLLTVLISLLPISLDAQVGLVIHDHLGGIRQVKWAIIATVLFLLRDLGILLLFNLGRFRHRADMAAILLGILLYWLIPALLNEIHMTTLLPLFLPLSGVDPASIVGLPLLQAGLIMWAVVDRLNRKV